MRRSLARWWGGGGGGGLEAEAVAGGVKDPGVEVGALHAGVQPQRLAGQLAGRQRARVGQRAVRLALVTKIFLSTSTNIFTFFCATTHLNIALFFPLLEVSEAIEVCGLLDPL